MTIEQLRQQILIELGHPFHQPINISTEHLDIIIARALHKFREHHFEGTEKDVYLLPVITGTRKYTLPDYIHTVISYYKSNLTTLPLSIRYHKLGVMSPNLIVDLISFSVLEMYAKTVDITLDPSYKFTFNETTRQLTFEHTPQTDETWGLQVYTTFSDETAYSNDWFQRYAVALSKYQYGWNLLKFDSNLPGLGKINYQLIVDLAREEIKELEEELINEHSAPIPILYG